MYRLCFFAVLAALRMSAQDVNMPRGEEEKNLLGLTFGAAHYRVIDEAFTASKLKFAGTIPATQLSYRRTNNKNMLVASLYASFGHIQTPDKSISSLIEQFELSFSYLRAAAKFNDRARLYAGGELSSMAYLRYDEKQLNNVSGLFIHGLFAHLLGEFDINGSHKIIAEMKLPALLFIKRENSDGGANVELEDEADEPLNLLFSDTYVSGLNPATYFRFNLGYEYRLWRRIRMGADYKFACVNEYSNGALRMYSNQLLGGFKFSF
jgi:hypothetical protein